MDIVMWNKLVHPEDLKASNESMIRHLNGEIRYYDYEVRMKHKDGRWIWIHDKGKVTERDRDGYPVKMFGTNSNISARKQASENLIESEKRFLLALDETKAGLWDYDMINNKIFLSPMWKNILGYSDDEIEKDEITIDKLVALADKRMYSAKNNGRNQIICD